MTANTAVRQTAVRARDECRARRLSTSRVHLMEALGSRDTLAPLIRSLDMRGAFGIILGSRDERMRRLQHAVHPIGSTVSTGGGISDSGTTHGSLGARDMTWRHANTETLETTDRGSRCRDSPTINRHVRGPAKTRDACRPLGRAQRSRGQDRTRFGAEPFSTQTPSDTTQTMENRSHRRHGADHRCRRFGRRRIRLRRVEAVSDRIDQMSLMQTRRPRQAIQCARRRL